ncbi:MAG: bifunctional 4-hydroxy-3-methylbut-2-enyl diphosphate reductase/30S ribosomal protein S1 [Candidatus Pelethousia sp.]|nr:bifunctional 4-hydroxy-3-methylbut-2-enyl diphosphate reductase/30S ribosomal protein S1 [Candidatus Pelethousia sp.]
MKVLTAQNIGFCFGVERAMEMARTAAGDGTVYTYGELIHNSAVIEKLEGEGIHVARTLLEVPIGAHVVIRSHGLSPEDRAALEARAGAVTDATCPFVSRIHRIVEEQAAAGCPILIFGAADHPEVRGIAGHARGADVRILQSIGEAEALPAMELACLVSQTTAQKKDFEAVAAILRAKINDFRYYATICPSTSQRQEEAAQLSKKCTHILVVGGHHSSNTQKLADICKKYCKQVQSIANPDEVLLENIDTNDIIGVVGGASTPIWIIMEVITRMSELEKTMAESPEIEKVEAQEAATVETSVPAEAPVAEPEAQAPEAAEASAPAVEDTAEPSFEEAFEKTLVRIRNGQIIKGTVLQIVNGEVGIDIGYKADGYIPRSEFSANPDIDPADSIKVGDEIEVEVLKVNDGEGNVLLSRKNVESKKLWDDLMEDEDIQNKVFEGMGKEVVKGGLIATIEGIRAFIPASQLSTKYVENIGEYVGQPLSLKVIEVDKARKRIVASHKAVMMEEADQKRKELWGQLVVGSKVHGVVRRLTDFGAFVDIGGIDGLVHVTDVAWGRVKHPSDVLSIGQEVDLLIRDVDVEKQRVSLGYKQLQPKPWTMADQKYPVGSIVEGKVVRIVPFGAFVALEPTIDGLIHISQVGVKRIDKVEDEINVGDIVRCKVLDVNPEAKRISLSRREVILEENPEIAEQLAAERAERERIAQERAEHRAPTSERPERPERTDRPERHERTFERSSAPAADRGERRERRPRREDSDYDLPPVPQSTTSLADLFSAFTPQEGEEN